jgi:hypothetical protein
VFPLLLSLLLLLGHQLVPHLHEAPVTEPSIGETETHDLGWIGLIFSLDQGAEHLEHYRQMQGNELQPDLQLLALPTAVVPVLPALPWHCLQPLQADAHPPIPLDFIACAQLLRGPPSC